MSLLEYDPWTFGPESRPITKEDIKLRGYEGTTSLRYATPVEKGGN